MLDIQTQYQSLLEELATVKTHAEQLARQLQDFAGDNREFVRLFVGDELTESATACANAVEKNAETLQASVDAAIKNLPLVETYAALCAQRDELNAHVDMLYSPGMHVTALLKKAGAAGTEPILERLQLDGVLDALETYQHGVERLSGSAVDVPSFQNTFTLHKGLTHAFIQACRGIRQGSIIQFGHYPQTAAGTDQTPIEWQVLEVRDGMALLISRYALDCQPYDQSGREIWWVCSLRNWLNGEFKNKAFSSSELEMIATTDIQLDKYSKLTVSKPTQDQIFLLSIIEAQQHFSVSGNGGRMCVPTAYAIAHGANTNRGYTVDGKATCWWWLRSPGYLGNRATSVNIDGSILSEGNIAYSNSGCVRPALWLKLPTEYN